MSTDAADPVCECAVCECNRRPERTLPPFELCYACTRNEHSPKRVDTLAAYFVDRFGWTVSHATAVEAEVMAWTDKMKAAKGTRTSGQSDVD